MVVHNVSVNIAGTSAVAVTADVIARTLPELQDALGRRETIEVAIPDLERKIRKWLKLRDIVLIGGILAFFLFKFAIERQYTIDASWKMKDFEGRIILTPPLIDNRQP